MSQSVDSVLYVGLYCCQPLSPCLGAGETLCVSVPISRKMSAFLHVCPLVYVSPLESTTPQDFFLSANVHVNSIPHHLALTAPKERFSGLFWAALPNAADWFYHPLSFTLCKIQSPLIPAHPGYSLRCDWGKKGPSLPVSLDSLLNNWNFYETLPSSYSILICLGEGPSYRLTCILTSKELMI